MKVNSIQHSKTSGNFSNSLLCYSQTLDTLDLTKWHITLYRRACSLDVEVSASGYSKELQRDDHLLHPEGPEGEGLSGDEDDDISESADDTHQAALEDVISIEEYKQAMLELEGLNISKDTPTEENDTEEHEGAQCEEEIPSEDIQKETVSDITKDLEREEENEVEDECPDLVDLSASNKEFRPFR